MLRLLTMLVWIFLMATTPTGIDKVTHHVHHRKHLSTSVRRIPVCGEETTICGEASWYDLPGRTTSNGDPFISTAHKCAMLRFPMGTRVTIIDIRTRRRSYCTVNDHGPYVAGRVIDVTPRVASDLGILGSGIGPVRVTRPL